MREEDLLQCPLLQGLDAMGRAELLGLLNKHLGEKREDCMAKRSHCAESRENPVTAAALLSPGRSFGEEVPGGHPAIRFWRKGAKE